MSWKKDEIEECFKKICLYISEGNSLRSALKLDNTPGSATFYQWLEEDPEKQKHYARACEERSYNIFEDILDIADDNTRDIKVLPDGKEVVDNEVVQRSKVRIDARKFFLSKVDPKKYGDRVDIRTVEEILPTKYIDATKDNG